MTDITPDRELLRLHRRACTDFAARLRLPAWGHLPMPLAFPMQNFTVGDLLSRAATGNLETAAELTGQNRPKPVVLGLDPTEVVVESVRTVLAVVAGLNHGTGFSPQKRELLWSRIVELTLLGYDLQQAIKAGAGLDDLLVDRIVAAAPEVSVWPFIDGSPVEMSTPPTERLLAQHGRSAGVWVDPNDPNCGTGQC